MVKNYNLTFPENIIRDVFNDNINVSNETFIKNFINISRKIFTVLEQEALKNRYIDNLDLREIGRIFNISYECARLKFADMKKKLTQKAIINYIETGIYPSKTPVEFLQISQRSYNGLVDNDIHYAEDIVNMTYDDLAGLPKVGTKIADTIINALNDFGFDISSLKNSPKVVFSIKKFMRTHNLSKADLLKYIDLV